MRKNRIGFPRHQYVEKKHSRKSIEWHKKRIMARLNPKVDKGQSLKIVQIAGLAAKQSMLFIEITSSGGQTTAAYLKKYIVQEHHRIVRALRYLVDGGKLESNMTTTEWEMQLALGTADKREFKLNKE